MSNCCPSPKAPKDDCHTPQTQSIDWLLWMSLLAITALYGLQLWFKFTTPHWLHHLSLSTFELVNTMFWGVLVGIVMIGIIGRIPREFVVSILGSGRGHRGILRATCAGVLLDLCSHGILMVGAKLYERGASIGQVMAFIIASPWNSLTLTIILVALIGLFWTLTFIVLSMLIAFISGMIFDALVARKVLPANPVQLTLPENFQFWREAKAGLSKTEWSGKWLTETLGNGLKDSRMVLRWLLFGILLASALRALLPMAWFQTAFGPTVLGLSLTILFSTVLEVCSEGSTPIAADILNRAQAPGNGFAFLMGGVSTDYTEIMVLKETTSSWRIALFLPLVTLPQIIVLALIINAF